MAAASRASSASSGAARTRGAAWRSASGLPVSGLAHPEATSWVSSAVRAKPPIRAAAPERCARRAKTSRAFGYGARGSACRSSPSSQSTTRPRSATGANIAALVPATILTVPRSAASQRR